MISVVLKSITDLKVDAIVNAANTSLTMGSGVCGAIFNAAGVEQLTKACKKLAPVMTAEPVITEGFNLYAKYIIHVAGPVYDGTNNSEFLLRDSYKNSLELARQNKIKSIAFPLISAGIYGYPLDEAIDVAVYEAFNFIENNPDMDIYFAVLDEDIRKKLQSKIESYKK